MVKESSCGDCLHEDCCTRRQYREQSLIDHSPVLISALSINRTPGLLGDALQRKRRRATCGTRASATACSAPLLLPRQRGAIILDSLLASRFTQVYRELVLFDVEVPSPLDVRRKPLSFDTLWTTDSRRVHWPWSTGWRRRLSWPSPATAYAPVVESSTTSTQYWAMPGTACCPLVARSAAHFWRSSRGSVP